MKKLNLKAIFILSTMFYGNLCSSQTNLIKNPSFELGNLPAYNPGANIDYNPMPTDWTIGPRNLDCSGTGNPLVYDDQFVNVNPMSTSRYGIPHNYYTSYSQGVTPFPITQHRYMKIHGGSIDIRNLRLPIPSDQAYGDNIISSLLNPLQAGFCYKVRLYAIPLQVDPTGTTSAKGQINYNFNQIQIVFFKNGVVTPCNGYIAATSQPIVPAGYLPYSTYLQWRMVEVFFIVPLNAHGYDRIQIRMRPNIITNNSTPEDRLYTGVMIDSVGLYNIDPPFTPTTNYTFTTFTFNNSTNTTHPSPWSGKNISIVNHLIVDKDLTINNGTKIRLATNAKITVLSGRKLIIDNSVLSGNCNMWQGIIVENFGKIEFTNSKLYDAVTGIKLSGLDADFKIHSSVFDANITHIELNNCTSDGNDIYGNNFYHTIGLKIPALTNPPIRTPPIYGEYGIKIKNSSYQVIKIGKATENKNYFRGGLFGLFIEQSNVDVINNNFSLITEGIKATGTISSVRTLNISGGNVFLLLKTGITATINYNLNVYNNIFEACSNNGIVWTKNNDRTLNIGNATYSNSNSFTNCKPASILLSMNGTLKTASLIDNLGRTTRISIFSNTFANAATSSGIVISEITGSKFPHYQKLLIVNNTVTNIGLAVKLSNIVGLENKTANSYLRGMRVAYYPPGDPFFELVFGNFFYFNNTTNPEYTSIKVENTRGVQFIKKFSSNITPYNWQNKGIWLDNSSHSRVTCNSIKAGVGVFAAGNMLQSNIMCNYFSANITNIQLANEYLRNGPTDLHGKLYNTTTFDELSRHNFTYDKPWHGQDIELWGSTDVNLNKWVYDYTLTPPVVKRNNILISNLEGGRAITECTSLTGNLFSPLNLPDCGAEIEFVEGQREEEFNLTFSNFVMNWNYKYYAEKTFAEKDTLIGTKDENIAKIIEIESNINNGESENATQLLLNFNPTNSIETNYTYLLNVYNEMLDTNFEHLDSIQILNVDNIASQKSIIGGIPVFIARAILFKETGIDYSFIDDDDYLTIKGKLMDSLGCIPDTLQGIGIALVDENLNRIPDVGISYTNAKGEFTFDPHILKTLDSNTMVGFITWPSNSISTYNPEYKPIYEWIDTVFKDVLTTKVFLHVKAEYTDVPTFINDTVILNTDASQYFVKNAKDNFVVSKTGSQFNWSKIFNGYLNNYDKAIGIKKHENGNLYLVSNLIADERKGVEIWCLDGLGNLIWKNTLYDTFYHYEALGFDTTIEGGVQMAVEKTDEAGNQEIVLLEINTCLSYINKYISEEVGGNGKRHLEPKTNEPLSVKIIPNPNQGSFVIAIENSNANSIFELYTIQGIKVYQKNVKDGYFKIQLSDGLSKGIYIGKVTDSLTKHQKAVRIVID